MQISDILHIQNPFSEPNTPFLPSIPLETTDFQYSTHINEDIETLPPIMPTKWSNDLIPKMKTIPIEKWNWINYQIQSRNDHLKLFHWEKEGSEDNPFIRYNTTEEEYQDCIPSDGWTFEQTDHLFELCNKFDLRWNVISDRYSLLPCRTEEECKYRYYSVCRLLLIHRKQMNQVITPYEELLSQYQYDKEDDIERNLQFDKLFKISKFEELEMNKLEKELHIVEALIKEILSDSTKVITRHSHNINPDDFTTYDELFRYIRDPNKIYHPIYPQGISLRSQRFELTAGKSGVLSTLLKVVQSVMAEFGIPNKMIMATDRICNVYDQIKQSVMKLIVLQRHVSQRESSLIQAEESQNFSGMGYDTKKRKLQLSKAPKKKLRAV